VEIGVELDMLLRNCYFPNGRLHRNDW